MSVRLHALNLQPLKELWLNYISEDVST